MLIGNKNNDSERTARYLQGEAKGIKATILRQKFGS